MDKVNDNTKSYKQEALGVSLVAPPPPPPCGCRHQDGVNDDTWGKGDDGGAEVEGACNIRQQKHAAGPPLREAIEQNIPVSTTAAPPGHECMNGLNAMTR